MTAPSFKPGQFDSCQSKFLVIISFASLYQISLRRLVRETSGRCACLFSDISPAFLLNRRGRWLLLFWHYLWIADAAQSPSSFAQIRLNLRCSWFKESKCRFVSYRSMFWYLNVCSVQASDYFGQTRNESGRSRFASWLNEHLELLNFRLRHFNK